MPLYCYQCPRCGKKQERARSVKSRNRVFKCECGETVVRDITSEGVKTEKDWAHEVLSDSMGVAASQVAEHRRRHPNIPLTEDGRIIVRNAAEERRIKNELKGDFNKTP